MSPRRPRFRSGGRGQAAAEREFERFLDGTLRREVRGSGEPTVDVTAGVLRSLGFRPMEAEERRARRRRSRALRTLTLAILGSAAMAGLVAHNWSPGAIKVDRSLPHAIDRAVFRILHSTP